MFRRNDVTFVADMYATNKSFGLPYCSTSIIRHMASYPVCIPQKRLLPYAVSLQGQENDIILISLVRSNKEGKIGYLSSMNRLCVAISRARCGLYLFGNHAHLAKASRKGWKVWGICGSGFSFPFSKQGCRLFMDMV